MTAPPDEAAVDASEHALATLRRQYHLRPGPHGLRAWDVHRLIRLSRALPVQRLALERIRELDQNWWFDDPKNVPTPRAIVSHLRLMDTADLRWPVILSADGGVMDGMHRITQALRLGHTHIAVVQFETDPAPDHVGVAADELDYG